MEIFILFFVKKILLGILIEVGMTCYCLKRKRWLLWIIATYFIVIHCLLAIFPLMIYIIYMSDYILAAVLFFKYTSFSEKAKSLLILFSIFLFLWLSVYVLFAPIVSKNYRFTEFEENKETYVVIQEITRYSHFAQEGTRTTSFIYKDHFFTPEHVVENSSRSSGEYVMIPALPKNRVDLEDNLKKSDASVNH